MGRIIDLSVPTARVVDPAVLDANVVVARFVSSYPGQHPSGPPRASQFFRSLVANNAIGLVTPTAFIEVIHVAIRAKYAREVATHRPALTTVYGSRRRYSWLDLYKIDPSILQAYAPVLEQLRLRMASHNIVVVGPDRLGPIPSGLAYDQEVVRLVGRYGLDTSDVAILMEAQRIGVAALVTLDPDMRRARADFDVYTWL
jgi:predicted nucleic acid-binding protein